MAKALGGKDGHRKHGCADRWFGQKVEIRGQRLHSKVGPGFRSVTRFYVGEGLIQPLVAVG